MDLKKISLALAAAFGVSAGANAAIYEAPIVGCENLSVACDEEPGLIIGAQYVGFVDTTGDFLGKNNKLFSGLFAELGWQFEQGTDIMVNYTGQFDTTANRQTFGGEIPLSDQHHIVNMEVGKTVHVGPRTNMRFHLGGQYLYIEREVSDIPYRHHSNATAEQRFSGFGPRGGFQGEYWFNEWFAVDGAMAVSVLVGDSRARFTKHNQEGEDTIISNSTVRVVTAGVDGHLGAKVDLSKTHPSMQNVPVEILAGYRWYTYPSAMNNTFLASNPAPKHDDKFSLLAGQGHFGSHGFFVGARTKIARDMFGGWL